MRGFEHVLGHASAVARLRKAADGGAAGGAYILDGEAGIGKKTLANAFARALQCEGTGEAGCACVSCRVFKSGNHPDVLYVTGTKTKSIGVDDVRAQIIEPMGVKPFRYRYQVFIVDAAETLTPAAQNALLKTAEEPGSARVLLFLTANIDSLLPTVISRCVRVKLCALPDGLVLQALTARGVPPETASFCAAYACGNIGRALRFSESEELAAMRDAALAVTATAHTLSQNEAMRLFARFEGFKDSVQTLLDICVLCFRDMIMCRAVGPEAMTQQAAALQKTAAALSLGALYRGLEAVEQAKRALRANGNFQLSIELMLLALHSAS